MDASPPGKSAGRKIVERAAEAALGSVPLVGAALAVTLVTTLNWRLEERREKWFTELAGGVEELRQRMDGLSLESLVGNDVFTDAVVMATRTVEHTHQAEKIEALRNAVLNSATPGAPDADTQAVIMGLIDRFTPSHLRLVTLWDDPPPWFASHGIPQPPGRHDHQPDGHGGGRPARDGRPPPALWLSRRARQDAAALVGWLTFPHHGHTRCGGS